MSLFATSEEKSVLLPLVSLSQDTSLKTETSVF